jgi:hypothetical protein
MLNQGVNVPDFEDEGKFFGEIGETWGYAFGHENTDLPHR